MNCIAWIEYLIFYLFKIFAVLWYLLFKTVLIFIGSVHLISIILSHCFDFDGRKANSPLKTLRRTRAQPFLFAICPRYMPRKPWSIIKRRVSQNWHFVSYINGVVKVFPHAIFFLYFDIQKFYAEMVALDRSKVLQVFDLTKQKQIWTPSPYKITAVLFQCLMA